MHEIKESDEPLNLFERYLSGKITAGEAETLARRLNEEPSLGDRFLDMIDVDLLLRDHYQAERKLSDEAINLENLVAWEKQAQPLPKAENFPSSDPKTASPKPTAAPKKSRISSPSVLIPAPILVLVLLCFGILAVYSEFFWRPSADQFPTSDQDLRNSVAVVSANLSAEFSDPEWHENAVGQTLTSRNLRLESGLIELLFFNGTRLVVEGSADLVFVSGNQVFCSEGTLSATVPKSGHGFEIATPFTTIRDLGTEFIVDVSADRSAVHVRQGRVEAFRKGETPRMLKKGENLVRGFSDTVDFDFVELPRRFISRQEIRKRVFEQRLRRWNDSGTENDQVLAPVIRFDPSGSNVQTKAEGGLWVEGATPDRKALQFSKLTDRVTIESSKALDGMTITARLKIDELNPNGNPILMSRGSERGGVLWQILPDGSLSFAVRTRNNIRAQAFNSPIVVTEDRLGRWLDLAVVVDVSTRTITQYLDGEIVFSALYTVSQSHRLDGACIGNWIQRNAPSRNFSGAVEALDIYDRPLHPGELDRLYLSESSSTVDSFFKPEENHE